MAFCKTKQEDIVNSVTNVSVDQGMQIGPKSPNPQEPQLTKRMLGGAHTKKNPCKLIADYASFLFLQVL